MDTTLEEPERPDRRHNELLKRVAIGIADRIAGSVLMTVNLCWIERFSQSLHHWRRNAA